MIGYQDYIRSELSAARSSEQTGNIWIIT